jgi:hypothetical protein
MRRQDRPCHARQLELFRPETPNLEWRQLPEDVRGTVARLMARMLWKRQQLGAGNQTAGGQDDE